MSQHERPRFFEIKMDAGSYQEDSDPLREGPAFVASDPESVDAGG
jgi:hypothetical protein